MTIRTPVIAGNWKLNLGPSDAALFVRELISRLPANLAGTIALFPPALSMAAVREALGSRRDVLLGVQNLYWETSGAFTGELSAPMAADAGAALALVGHSERRHLFGETDEDTARKVASVLDVGITPILCVGETLEERESGEAERVVRRQLRAVLDAMDPAVVPRLCIAYEPVWAIGTGRTATSRDASEMHGTIRELLGETSAGAQVIPILYGGSVKAENARELLAAQQVDGLLIGGASLDVAAFSAICQLAA